MKAVRRAIFLIFHVEGVDAAVGASPGLFKDETNGAARLSHRDPDESLAVQEESLDISFIDEETFGEKEDSFWP